MIIGGRATHAHTVALSHPPTHTHPDRQWHVSVRWPIRDDMRCMPEEFRQWCLNEWSTSPLIGPTVHPIIGRLPAVAAGLLGAARAPGSCWSSAAATANRRAVRCRLAPGLLSKLGLVRARRVAPRTIAIVSGVGTESYKYPGTAVAKARCTRTRSGGSRAGAQTSEGGRSSVHRYDRRPRGLSPR